MQCPKCDFTQPGTAAECPRCGVIFSKLKTPGKTVAAAATENQAVITDEDSEDASDSFFQQIFLHIKAEVNPFSWSGRVLVWIVLFIWGWIFITSSIDSNAVGTSFLHGVNLAFHEAGHIVFRPCGKFIATLGGSLGQLLMPFICLVVFLLKTRDPFGGSVALWWLGQNFIDLAPYINDARDLKLMLLGGVTGKETIDYHDWEYILRKMGMLSWDHTLAKLSHVTGSICMLTAFAWGGYVLWRQYRNIQKIERI